MNNLTKKTILWGIIGAITYIVLFLFLDKPIILWVNEHLSDSLIYKIAFYISFSAQSSIYLLAIIISIILILLFDKKRETKWAKTLFYIWGAIALAMLVGGVLKITLARYRPIMLFKENLYGLHLFSLKWILHSTPSGHTLRAFALFISLAIIDYKRKYLYILLAISVGISRVLIAKHFPSDIIFGAYIGIFSSYWVFSLSKNLVKSH